MARRRRRDYNTSVIATSAGHREQLVEAASATPGGAAAVEAALATIERELPDAPAVLARGIPVAISIAQLRLDTHVLAAALVRPACESGLPTARVVELFGAEEAALCDGVARLEHVRWDHLEQEATENLRKMFLAIASDIRVVLRMTDSVNTFSREAVVGMTLRCGRGRSGGRGDGRLQHSD